jgi:glutathione S-transferase
VASSSELRLVTIPISHYCEKARWALERAGVPYREERHVQAVHRFAARRAGGGSTVPVLVTPEGSIGESEEILDWIDARTPPEHRLQPTDPAAREETTRLSRRFDALLGPHGRRLMYVNMLTQRELMLTFNNQGVPAWEDRLLRVGFPFAVRWAKGALAIEPGIEVEDEAIVWQEFDYVAELLADGRPYLVTDSFGAADLTFAALCASVIVPPIYGVPLPQPDELPPGIAALVNRAREHPAGAFALGLYEKHRRERVGHAVAA